MIVHTAVGMEEDGSADGGFLQLRVQQKGVVGKMLAQIIKVGRAEGVVLLRAVLVHGLTVQLQKRRVLRHGRFPHRDAASLRFAHHVAVFAVHIGENQFRRGGVHIDGVAQIAGFRHRRDYTVVIQQRMVAQKLRDDVLLQTIGAQFFHEDPLSLRRERGVNQWAAVAVGCFQIEKAARREQTVKAGVIRNVLAHDYITHSLRAVLKAEQQRLAVSVEL